MTYYVLRNYHISIRFHFYVERSHSVHVVGQFQMGKDKIIFVQWLCGRCKNTRDTGSHDGIKASTSRNEEELSQLYIQELKINGSNKIVAEMS